MNRNSKRTKEFTSDTPGNHRRQRGKPNVKSNTMSARTSRFSNKIFTRAGSRSGLISHYLEAPFSRNKPLFDPPLWCFRRLIPLRTISQEYTHQQRNRPFRTWYCRRDNCMSDSRSELCLPNKSAKASRPKISVYLRNYVNTDARRKSDGITRYSSINRKTSHYSNLVFHINILRYEFTISILIEEVLSRFLRIETHRFCHNWKFRLKKDKYGN